MDKFAPVMHLTCKRLCLSSLIKIFENMGCREVISKKQLYLPWKISKSAKNPHVALERKAK